MSAGDISDRDGTGNAAPATPDRDGATPAAPATRYRDGATPAAPVTPDRDRLAARFTRMAAITDGVPGEGCERLAFGPGEHAAHREFARQAAEAGLTVERDRFGNTFARLEPAGGGVPATPSAPGTAGASAAILCGSHLDTVAGGGCYDGAAGVLSALEAVATLAEAQRRGAIVLTSPIEVVAWANEEGARFAPAMMGSAVYTGALPLDEALAASDRDGTILRDALATDPDRTGSRATPGPVPMSYLELHIEQARTLENRGLPFAVVDGVQAQIAGDWEMRGREDHAGATPMGERVDALVAAAVLVTRTKEIARGGAQDTAPARGGASDTTIARGGASDTVSPDAAGFHDARRDTAPPGVATVGSLTVRPGSRNSIPGVVTGTIDMRHPAEEHVASMATSFIAAGNAAAAAEGATFRYTELWRAPKVTFDADLVELLQRSARNLGVPHATFPSAAGHDAVHLQQVCPSAMLFVPSRDGVSHNPAEYTDLESLFTATRVLTVALAERGSDGNNGGVPVTGGTTRPNTATPPEQTFRAAPDDGAEARRKESL